MKREIETNGAGAPSENSLANVKVIASPLARASVDYKVEIITAGRHRKQGASGDCYPRVVRLLGSGALVRKFGMETSMKMGV